MCLRFCVCVWNTRQPSTQPMPTLMPTQWMGKMKLVIFINPLTGQNLCGLSPRTKLKKIDNSKLKQNWVRGSLPSKTVEAFKQITFPVCSTLPLPRAKRRHYSLVNFGSPAVSQTLMNCGKLIFELLRTDWLAASNSLKCQSWLIQPAAYVCWCQSALKCLLTRLAVNQ